MRQRISFDENVPVASIRTCERQERRFPWVSTRTVIESRIVYRITADPEEPRWLTSKLRINSSTCTRTWSWGHPEPLDR
jgi:hypothetical protein